MFTGVYMSAWEQKSGEQKVLRGTKVHLGTKVSGTKVSGTKVLFHWAEIKSPGTKVSRSKVRGMKVLQPLNHNFHILCKFMNLLAIYLDFKILSKQA